MRQTVGRALRCSAAVTAALGAAAVVSGCAATDRLMTSVELPATDASAPPSDSGDPAGMQLPPPPGADGSAPSKLVVTGQQRDYLDALVAGGVHPSSDLMALSIGSYVCQARAARQSDQAVWDFVHPLVTNDVRSARGSAAVISGAPARADVDAATRTYIRIATQRLC